MFKFLQGENLFKPTNTYYTEFDYNALSASSVVTIKGNSVGKISDVKYDFKTGKTRVAFSVDPQLEFSKNSIIRLYETGLMGGNALAIIAANDTEFAKPGDLLKSEVQPGLITSLRDNFAGLSTDLDRSIRTADTLMINLNTLVTDKSDDGIKQTIVQLNSTLKSFKILSESITSMVGKNDKKVALLVDNFSETSENLKLLSAELNELELKRTVSNLDSTLVAVKSIMASIENGEGSMGKLLNDDKLYNNLEGAALQLELLLEDFKLNPKRYVHFSVFGKKAQPYFIEEETIEEKDN